MAEIGEYAKGRHVELTAVEYAGTVAAGDPLKITGVADDGTTKVQKAGGLDTVRFFAIQGNAGVSGDVKQVLMRGYIYTGGTGKTTAVPNPGSPLRMKDGKIGSEAAASTSFGYTIDVLAADGAGWIYFTQNP